MVELLEGQLQFIAVFCTVTSLTTAAGFKNLHYKNAAAALLG